MNTVAGMKNKIELLSPARDMEQLRMSLAYGADAVYMAGKRFGLRQNAGNFGAGELESAIALVHARGACAYITLNAVMTSDDMRGLPRFLEELSSAGADAVIVSDIGVIGLAKKYAPGAEIHISTQAGVMSHETASALYDMGASRVILARELTLAEIRDIRDSTPPCLTLEAFVHGSMCVSFSGRCLLSNYLTGRDANRGDCAQPCRWKYHLIEEQRPGEYLEITEDSGTFIMNSRDLCMIGHVGELIDAGVTSLKIEGRMKSAYYAAVITGAYRHAIDAAVRGEPLSEVWREEVNKVSHREYSTGFYYSDNGPGQQYGDAMYSSECDVAAVVEGADENGYAILTQRNRFFHGDKLDLLIPGGGEPVTFTAEGMRDMDGAPIDVVPHPMMQFKMALPVNAPELSIVRKYK